MEAARAPIEEELSAIDRRRNELLGDLDAINTAIQALSGGGSAPATQEGGSGIVEHTGKYRALWSWLQTQTQSQLSLSFSDVEEVLGFSLPASSRRHLPHWYGYKGSAVARAIRDAGWRAKNVRLQDQTLELYRVAGGQEEDLTDEQRFHRAMINIYERAKAETGYVPTRFLRMVTDQGGVAAAQQLLRGSGVSDGFTTLWQKGRLDLSVEALVLRSEFHELFSSEERHIARSRLRQYDYEPGDQA